MKIDYESRPDAAIADARRRRLAMCAMLVVGLAVIAVALLRAVQPMTNNQRIAADHDRCAATLGRIDRALGEYASAHAGQLPASLETLVTTGELPASSLICPGAHDGVTVSYLLVAENGRPAMLNATAPIVVETADCYDDEGVHVLFADGSIEYLTSKRRGTTLPWWSGVQTQIERGDRPVKLDAPRLP